MSKQVSNSKSMKATVLSILKSNGFHFYNETETYNPTYYNVAVKNPSYTSIYGHKSKNDYLLIYNGGLNRVRIDVKWQQASGSVDHKFPFYFLNAQQTPDDEDYIMVLDGGGYSSNAKNWLIEAAEKHNEENKKKIEIIDLSGFMKFIHEITKGEL